ncbi:MAG: SWIM zinc finger family protein [Propionibacteriaceae bacterium]|jgi:uncharacterized Zn finger protein|nr:SWIM zinc finger family protein [Propionibacteriaceae bacterium]
MSSRWYPPPSRPRAVEGGLKARSKRGGIAQTWWSNRFIEVLESYGLGNRLARGRNYARRGQVLDLDIAAGAVEAKVQGSRARPYRVRVSVRAFGKADWAKVAQAMADDAWYAAKLLSGEMPEDIEKLFSQLDLPLFPLSARELDMDCSCPDWEVPCKHLAAVFYLLAEAFDDDPFLIFAWRGRDRDDLLDALSASRGGAVSADRAEPAAGPPLADCLATFFAAGPLARPHAAPAPRAALLDQAPAPSVAVRGVPFADALRPAYEA